MQQPFIRRISEPETPVGWSLILALFFVLAYAILWIAGQVIVTTLSGASEVPTADSLSLGALIGCIVIILGTIQWARRRSPDDWINWLRLRQPKTPAVFVVVLTGLGAAWAIDLSSVLTGGTADPWYSLLQPFLMLLVVALVRAYTQSTQSAIVARAFFGVFFVVAAVISVRF